MEKKLQELAERIEAIKDNVLSEEATKTSMIMPFFQILGYDVFNPIEFVPEFTADVGIKTREKVDYAIMENGSPLILVECKPHGADLGKHGSQLFRYYATTTAKFGILTNGIEYRFFTDLDATNKMDERPFLTINILNLKDRDVSALKKFEKGNIDVSSIIDSAENMKYTRLIKEWLSKQIETPDEDFIRLILSNVYSGRLTQKVIDEFKPIIKKSFNQYFNDSFDSQLKTALNRGSDEDEMPAAEEEKTEEPQPEEKARTVETTIEELETYGIIKSILRKVVDPSRVFYRDTINYFGILLDDNNRKWICRVFITPKVKYIRVFDGTSEGKRYDIDVLDDIYKYSEEIISACQAKM